MKKTMNKKIELYVDASLKQAKIGRCAGVFINEDGDEISFSYSVDNDKIITKYNNSIKKNTPSIESYEMYSFLIALIHINCLKDLDVTVYTDNQSFFNSINEVGKFKNNTYNYKISKTIKKHISSLKILNNINFEVRWIPGHSNIWYNNIADKLTQKNQDIKLNLKKWISQS